MWRAIYAIGAVVALYFNALGIAGAIKFRPGALLAASTGRHPG
jgi:hypothetical protein